MWEPMLEWSQKGMAVVAKGTRTDMHRGLYLGQGDQAWKQQPGEPAAVWEAFFCYLRLGPTRSIPKALDLLKRSNPDVGAQWKDPRYLEPYSSEWHWVDRVEAWDRWRNDRRLAGAQAAQRQSVQRELELVQDGLALVQVHLKRRLAATRRTKADVMGDRDLREWTRDLVTLARLQRGQPTDIIENVSDVTARLEAKIRQMVAARRVPAVPKVAADPPATGTEVH